MCITNLTMFKPACIKPNQPNSMVIERHKLLTTILLHSLIPRFEAAILLHSLIPRFEAAISLHSLIPRFEAAISLHSLIPRFEAAISLVCKDINLFFLLSSLSSWELRGIEG